MNENFVAVIGPQVAVSFAWSSCEGLPGSGNTVLSRALAVELLTRGWKRSAIVGRAELSTPKRGNSYIYINLSLIRGIFKVPGCFCVNMF